MWKDSDYAVIVVQLGTAGHMLGKSCHLACGILHANSRMWGICDLRN